MNQSLPHWLDTLLDRPWTPTASLMIDRHLALVDERNGAKKRRRRGRRDP